MDKPKRVVVAYFLDNAASVWNRYFRGSLAEKKIDLIVIIPSEPYKEALKELQENVEREHAAGRDVFCIVDIGICGLTPATNKTAAEIFDKNIPVARYSIDLYRNDPFEEKKKNEFFAQPELKRNWSFMFTFDDTPTDIAEAIFDWYEKQAVSA